MPIPASSKSNSHTAQAAAAAMRRSWDRTEKTLLALVVWHHWETEEAGDRQSVQGPDSLCTGGAEAKRLQGKRQTQEVS